MRAASVVMGVILLVGASASAEQEEKDTSELLDDALATRIAAFNAHDAKRFAKFYAEDADWMSTSGERLRGRAAIEMRFANLFSESPAVRTNVSVESRRLLSPGIALEDGTWELLGRNEDGLPSKGYYTMVLVKEHGQWLIDVERGWFQK
jgi:uncharacterized protein (TIGR02246 family)